MAYTPFGQVAKLTDTNTSPTNDPVYKKRLAKAKRDQRAGESVFSTTTITEDEMRELLSASLSEPEMDIVDQLIYYYKHGVQLDDSGLSLIVSYADPTVPSGGDADRIRADDDYPSDARPLIGVSFSF